MRHKRHFGPNDADALLEAVGACRRGLRRSFDGRAYRRPHLSRCDSLNGRDRPRGRGADGNRSAFLAQAALDAGLIEASRPAA